MVDLAKVPELLANIVQGLPASLALLAVVDYLIGSSLVDVYKTQITAKDPKEIYTYWSIMGLACVNLIIIISYGRIGYLQQKAKLNEPTALPQTNPQNASQTTQVP